MTRFTPEQIAAVRRESERLLRDDKPAAPAPEPPREVPVPASDPVQEWRDWHEARDREREAARDRMRREKHDAARARGADWAAYVDARIAAALAEHRAQFDELAEASAEFSNKVVQALERLDGLAAQLDTKLTELRALGDMRLGGAVLDLPDFRRRAN
jgi:hypothetical protein